MQGVSKRPLHLNTQRNWFLRRKICGIVKILAIQVFQLSRTFSWRSSASLRPTPSFCQTRPRRDCRNPSIRARFSLQRFLLTRLSNQNATATGRVVYKVVAGFRTSEPPHPPIPGCPDAVGGLRGGEGEGYIFPLLPQNVPLSASFILFEEVLQRGPFGVFLNHLTQCLNLAGEDFGSSATNGVQGGVSLQSGDIPLNQLAVLHTLNFMH